MKIGVVGAGKMGCGITEYLLKYGITVCLIDTNESNLDKAIISIRTIHRFSNKMVKEKDTYYTEENLILSTDLRKLEDVDMVIECITEDRERKKNLYRELVQICKKNVVYVSNTSCIPITQIGSYVGNGERVVGIHFMNPVDRIETVELIRARQTSDRTLQFVKKFLLSIDKNYVEIEDAPGFVANRISHLFMNEAIWILYEGYAKVDDIDRVFRECYGHKMGPLETADLIGLDTVKASLEVLYEEYQDIKYRCCPLLARMVEAGELGRKTGKGFYEYEFNL